MYLLMFALSLNPSEEILLETNGMIFKLFDKSNVQFDGSLTLVNANTAYHLCSEGKLIRKFHGKGDGPGEFRYLSEALWDGTFYYLHDLKRGDFSVFDSGGAYMGRSNLKVRDLFFLKGRLIGSDTSPFQNKDHDGNPLVELTLHKSSDLVFTDKKFHFIDPIVFKFYADLKIYYMTEAKGLFYVLTELKNEICAYDMSYNKVACFELDLYGYVPPGEPWKRGLSRKKYFETIYSFSQICGLVAGSNRFAVAYFVPNEDDIMEPKTYVQIVDSKGQAIGKGQEINGTFLGGHNGSYYVVREDDELRYLLKKVAF